MPWKSGRTIWADSITRNRSQKLHRRIQANTYTHKVESWMIGQFCTNTSIQILWPSLPKELTTFTNVCPLTSDRLDNYEWLIRKFNYYPFLKIRRCFERPFNRRGLWRRCFDHNSSACTWTSQHHSLWELASLHILQWQSSPHRTEYDLSCL